jgi:hypothetical protein
MSEACLVAIVAATPIRMRRARFCHTQLISQPLAGAGDYLDHATFRTFEAEQ